MRVGYYQFRPLFGQPRRNVAKVLAALADTTADLIVLPELAFSGYHFRDREEALAFAEDPASSETVESLTALCLQGGTFIWSRGSASGSGNASTTAPC